MPGAKLNSKASPQNVIHTMEEALDELQDDEADFVDDIYDILDAVIPRTDDSSLPSLTFRVWVLGTIFGVITAFANMLAQFRTTSFQVTAYIGVLLSYPLGVFMAKTLPTKVFRLGSFSFSLNPGPFNHKEHGLIYVYCSTGVSVGYAINNIIGQKYILYQDSLTMLACAGFLFVTQCFGYGLAGLSRRYIVRPPAMLWPANLGTIALIQSFHKRDDDKSMFKMSRLKFFFIITSVMTVYQFIPSFVAPLIASISILCYLGPRNNGPTVLTTLGSGVNGLGFLGFSFDWSQMNINGPITTPLWAMFNNYCGTWLFLWVITPILMYNNAFGMDMKLGTDPNDGPNGTYGAFPLGAAVNTPALFDKYGNVLSASSLVDKETLQLRENLYNEKQPIYLSTWFAVSYMTSFLTFAAAVTHVIIWYGKDIWRRFRTAIKDLDTNDIHNQLMDVYSEVPDWWYLSLILVNIVIGIVVCQFGGFDLPWWGVVLSIALAVVSIIPIGVIQAISGQQIGLNVMSEFLIGLILPGRMIAVMTFKTFSYAAMIQALLLANDLKFGVYMKIPPRHMFIVQLWSTLVLSMIQLMTGFAIYQTFGRTETPIDPDHPELGNRWKLNDPESCPIGWSNLNFATFFNAGAIWGAIGPARFFGPSSPYFATLLGFPLGFFLPIIPYLLHKKYPHSLFHLINIPIISVNAIQPGQNNCTLITPVLVAIGVNYFVKRYRSEWWKRYAYVMSAGLDAGSALGLLIIFGAFLSNPNFQVVMPSWFGYKADGDGCAADYYLDCKMNSIQGSGFGKTYNISEDAFCSSIGFETDATVFTSL